MANIALVIGYAHTPYLFGPPSMWPQIRDRIRRGKEIRRDLPTETPAELESKYQRCMHAFSKLREWIESARPDVMIVIGDDQKEIFKSYVAGFTVYVGEKVVGKKLPGRVREVTGNEDLISVPNHQELAKEIVEGMATADFDIAFFDELENKEDGFGHAFQPPLCYLTPHLDLPVVPILVNCYYPPQPTPQRCYRFGLTLGNILKEVKCVQRVVVGVSGGLWHTPGWENATIDEKFDRQVLEFLASGQGEALRGMSEVNLVSGTGEIRNWIVAAGITGDKKWEIIDYVPIYYSPIGTGFGGCMLDKFVG